MTRGARRDAPSQPDLFSLEQLSPIVKPHSFLFSLQPRDYTRAQTEICHGPGACHNNSGEGVGTEKAPRAYLSASTILSPIAAVPRTRSSGVFSSAMSTVRQPSSSTRVTAAASSSAASSMPKL